MVDFLQLAMVLFLTALVFLLQLFPVAGLYLLIQLMQLPDAYNTCLPSGDQPLGIEAAGYQVSLAGVPPAAGTIYTCAMPDRFELKASHCPSGEKWGLPSTAAVLVIRRASPPVFGVTQMSPPYSKASCEVLIAGWRSSLVDCAVAWNCILKQNTSWAITMWSVILIKENFGMSNLWKWNELQLM